MRAHAGAGGPSGQAAPPSFHLHPRPFAAPRAHPAAGGERTAATASPATHDFSSISINPPAGAPIQREKETWWDKAKGAGNYLWNTARDSSVAAKTVASTGLATAGTALGALAVGGTAAVTGSVLAPAAAVGASAYLGYRALDWAMSPSAPKEQGNLDLPPEGLAVRPKKGKSKALKGKDDDDAPLTAHHKIPYNQIRDAINDATGNSWGSLIPGRQARAKANLAIWGARQGAGQDQQKIAPKGLNSTPHNFFMGPKESNRADDPESGLDTHFTASGTATPRSELALDITHQGGLSKMDHKELHRRLKELGQKRTQVSPYDEHEWVGPENARRQRGRPAGWGTMSTAQKVQVVENRKKAKQAEQQNRKKGKKKRS